MVKTATLLLFVMSTSISNDQSYSFIGFVNMEFMMMIAGFIVSVIMMLMGRNRPEKRLLSGIRAFFHGCAGISGGFARVTATKRVQERNNQQVHRLVRMIPGRLRILAQSLDYRLFPDNPPDKVNHLLDTLQSTASRLRIVARLLDRVVGEAATSNRPSPLGTKLPRQLYRLFERWAHLTRTTAASDQERAAFRQLYDELEQRLEAYESDVSDHQPDERMLMALTALLGGVRGLLDAMAETDRAIAEINWEQWAVARF